MTCLQLLPHGSLIVHHPAYHKKSEVVLAQLPARCCCNRENSIAHSVSYEPIKGWINYTKCDACLSFVYLQTGTTKLTHNITLCGSGKQYQLCYGKQYQLCYGKQYQLCYGKQYQLCYGKQYQLCYGKQYQLCYGKQYQLCYGKQYQLCYICSIYQFT